MIHNYTVNRDQCATKYYKTNGRKPIQYPPATSDYGGKGKRSCFIAHSSISLPSEGDRVWVGVEWHCEKGDSKNEAWFRIARPRRRRGVYPSVLGRSLSVYGISPWSDAWLHVQHPWEEERLDKGIGCRDCHEQKAPLAGHPGYEHVF